MACNERMKEEFDTLTLVLLILLQHCRAWVLFVGWLLRMACNERMKEEFDTLHEAVLEMLKVTTTGCMQSLKCL